MNPPVPPPSGPVNPPGSVTTPVPGGPATPGAVPTDSPAPGTITPETPTPVPTAAPTQPPIIVEPPQVSVEPGKTTTARVNSSLGTLTATVADPTVATVIVDQTQRVLYISGLKVGTTTATVTDSRSVTRDVAIRVAYAAGTVADETSLRVTGNPTSSDYLREAVALAATRAATVRSGASINVPPDTINVRGNLKIDNRAEIDVPVQIAGNGYLPVNGTTHVLVENTALPPILPARLLVSDYPERLTANGVLFTARLDRTQAQRFLYYHYNPGNEPARRILLKARNSSNAPATVQMIDGSAGPGTNEMEVGHLSTKRFLVREARNEGQVMTIAPGATMNLVDHPLPAANVISAILQLRLVSGDPLDLTLVAQDALAPTDQSIDTVQLLAGGAPHARGVYPVPTFFFERTYDVDGADLDIPIGQLPLPNLREGEALSGDYGVEQSMNVVVVNMTRGPRAIALYANPRGGRATGTFLIDGTLVQAHALAAFSRFKIWQETINAGTFRRIRIVTMPEGGSSYPLRLTFAQDDGSVGPGAPGSPIY
ncbi:MAG TPA: pilus assembly protein N-terminal domain-containing protein [Candidatus Elarobacter sp.]|nr:pilus assembly protein N-terminal domain-containing protein [Candidatus Elarobacter sp.]